MGAGRVRAVADNPTDRTLAPAVAETLSAERVLEILREHLPSFWRDRPIGAELRLDDAGIGLDSVDLLELLIACERELGRQLPTDLLVDEAMTVGDLVRKLRSPAS
jgi:acyl carrier protein